MDFGIEVKLNTSYEEAIKAVTQALQNEGFGVLTEIDVKATLKKKLDQDFRPYAILGACNPALAHKALSHVPEIGMLLPCNVTVEANEDGGAIVRFLNPKIMVQVGEMGKNQALVEVANDAYEKLQRAAELAIDLMDKIIITDLVVQGIVGINPDERHHPQDIVLNLRLYGDFRLAGASDNIEDCINYHSVAREISDLVKLAQRYTIEALANDIAKYCLKINGVNSVRVRVEKPHTIWTAKSAGVEITRVISDFDTNS